MNHSARLLALVVTLWTSAISAGIGDPQIKTDHPWYPGELAISTFDRLAETQAELYERVTGRRPQNDEQKVLAAWLWRNTHFAHGEEGRENLFGQGFSHANNATRDYWTGLFSHGFALCGTTHAQWCAEMEHLLGHGRARDVGVAGHNSFEVFLTGGPYGDGKWALLDHDLSTVVFSRDGSRLLSIPEVQANLREFTSPDFQRARQQGWLVSGLHRDDARGVFGDYRAAEYLAGYAGPPPRIHLRRGERLRRYFAPGLDDGKTFVFWGRNYNTAGVPGPERSRTWVNQPEKMHGSVDGAGHRDGQVRFANAVFTYTPNFADGTFREAVVASDKHSVTFEHQSPYVIAATPPNNAPWGIYDPGGRKGLVVEGHGARVTVSVDHGATWSAPTALAGSADLTDAVKGHRAYWLRFEAAGEKPWIEQFTESKLRWTTVCQTNVAVLPRLKDQGTEITYQASHEALVSAGPNRSQAEPHMVEGSWDSPRVTLELATPRGEPITHLYAATHVASGNPPNPNVKYQIEYSLDAGQSWQPVVADWQVPRRGQEPADFWSQSFCWGERPLPEESRSPRVRVRFRNDGGKANLRCELHAAYRVQQRDAVRVTYAWSDAMSDDRSASHVFTAAEGPQTWRIATANETVTRWVEMEPAP
jgi:hypothetical protein